MSWAQASLAQTSQSQVLDVFLADYAEEPLQTEVGVGVLFQGCWGGYMLAVRAGGLPPGSNQRICLWRPDLVKSVSCLWLHRRKRALHIQLYWCVPCGIKPQSD